MPAIAADLGVVSSRRGTDGADILAQVAGELKSAGTSLALARVQPAILDLWRKAGRIDAVGSDQVFATVREAAQQFEDDPARKLTPAG